MFLAQLLLDAAPDTGKVLTLTVRYYINDVLVENFAPQQRLETGAHTLALFYPFASVEAGTVTWQARCRGTARWNVRRHCCRLQ